MVHWCCVPHCPSISAKKSGVSFHKFPKDVNLRKVWLHKIRRDTRKSKRNPHPFEVNQHTKICSLHFLREDFKINAEKWRLKKGAVPTKFSWNKKVVVRRTGTKRQEQHKDDPMSPMCSVVGVGESLQAVEHTERSVSPSAAFSEAATEQDGFHEQANDCDKQDTTVDSDTLSTKGPSMEEEEMVVILMERNNENVDFQKLNSNVLMEVTHETKTRCVKTCAVQTDAFVYTGSVQCERVQLSSVLNFSIENFKANDKKIRFYTGFPSYRIFQIALRFVTEGNAVKMNFSSEQTKKQIRKKLSVENQFLLVLIKLRQDFPYEHLSTLFNISVSTVGNIFVSWINFLYLRLGCIDIWPHREVLLSMYPTEFLNDYPNVIGSLDATEFFLQKPSSFVRQSQTFSHYKNHNTLKGLLVVDANGAVIFASSLFTGSISDNKLLEDSGFLQLTQAKLEKGCLQTDDIFLADKGFTVQKLRTPIHINIPVFRITGFQFSPDEVEQTRYIAHERVHVERAIGRIKSFKILTHIVPISMLGCFNQIWTVCCLLSNFRRPLRAEYF